MVFFALTCPSEPWCAPSCYPSVEASHLYFSIPVRRPFPYSMLSMFLAIFGLCRLYYEVEIKGEHFLGLCRVGAIPCSLMGCILPYGLEQCL